MPCNLAISKKRLRRKKVPRTCLNVGNSRQNLPRTLRNSIRNFLFADSLCRGGAERGAGGGGAEDSTPPRRPRWRARGGGDHGRGALLTAPRASPKRRSGGCPVIEDRRAGYWKSEEARAHHKGTRGCVPRRVCWRWPSCKRGYLLAPSPPSMSVHCPVQWVRGGRRRFCMSKDTSQGGRARQERNPGADRLAAPAPRARRAPCPTAHTPMPPRLRSTAAARATSRPAPQAAPPRPSAHVRPACAACMRGAACTAARRIASACCACACLCRFACSRRGEGERGAGTYHPHHHGHHPVCARTCRRPQETRLERPSSPPWSRPASPEQARRASPAVLHLEGGRGGAPSTATATWMDKLQYKAQGYLYVTTVIGSATQPFSF